VRRQTEEKKQNLLKSGMNLMHLNGYSATSVDDIVRAAGIPKGSFYNFYKSKEGFAIDALHTFTQATMQKHVNILNDQTLNIKEKIKKFFLMNIKELKKGHFSMGCFVGNMAQEVGDTNSEMRKNIEMCFSQMQNGIVELIKAGIADKSVSKAADPERLAEFILNSWEGALLRMKTVKKSEPLDLFLEYLDVLLDKK
jgi:TetR/AcrR family transcriptional repressor of nem operon